MQCQMPPAPPPAALRLHAGHRRITKQPVLVLKRPYVLGPLGPLSWLKAVQFAKQMPSEDGVAGGIEHRLALRATYRPKSYTGLHLLTIELSLPKLLLGNNWQMLWDIPSGIVALDALLAACPALPALPSVADMTLSRLDVCYNYQVGENLPHYIAALARLDYPRRTTVRFNTQTVEFRCKSVKCKFYDKHAETLGQSPPGILRHEITLPRARAIRTALSFPQPATLADLTLRLLALLLQRDLHHLSIYNTPFATHNQAAATLTQQYGRNRGAYRFMALALFQTLDRNHIAAALGIKRGSVSELLSDVRKAGLSLSLSDNNQPLSPLRVELPTEIASQTPGVTLGSLAPGEEASPPCD